MERKPMLPKQTTTEAGGTSQTMDHSSNSLDSTKAPEWHATLEDPTGCRSRKPRTDGKTMVIDKGLGLHGWTDLLQTAAEHMDTIKVGFGTAPLYPSRLLQEKIELAKHYGVAVYPGGTFLEVAVSQGLVKEYFATAFGLGFNGIEISDGTIEMDRTLRSELILRALDIGFTVVTEYGKKCWGSSIEIKELISTVAIDTELGAELVIIEGRESGAGVGIFDEKGACKDDDILRVVECLPKLNCLMWEAPQKNQQVHLMQLLGPDIHFGNIAPADVLSLEALRRGLRSDTFQFGLSREQVESKVGR